jgi:hypothetical protein
MNHSRTVYKTPVPKDRAARRVRAILETPSPSLLPPWSNDNGWTPPEYYGTIRAADIDGDGKAELVGRAALGVQLWWYDSVAAAWAMLVSGQCGWTDGNGWTDVSRATTIRLADVNGDGICELVARNSTGMEVWQYLPGNVSCQQIATGGCNWTDGAKLEPGAILLHHTLRRRERDGVAEIIGRGANGIEVWSCMGGVWTQLGAGGCGWTDTQSGQPYWNQPQYYTTILAADVNSDGVPELVGRGPGGIEVWRFQASGQWTQLSAGACNWSDSAGWNVPEMYATIRAADVNGDGKAELIGRNKDGIELWEMGASGAWTELGSQGCGWTDTASWDVRSTGCRLRRSAWPPAGSCPRLYLKWIRVSVKTT